MFNFSYATTHTYVFMSECVCACLLSHGDGVCGHGARSLVLCLSHSTHLRAPSWPLFFLACFSKQISDACYVREKISHLHASNSRVCVGVCGYVCVCQVRAKSETWEGETRVKCNVVGLKPLDYAQESKLLLDRIRNYGI